MGQEKALSLLILFALSCSFVMLELEQKLDLFFFFSLSRSFSNFGCVMFNNVEYLSLDFDYKADVSFLIPAD
jgi:hypothetical protein